jgi:gliding motility-associated-like protein
MLRNISIWLIGLLLTVLTDAAVAQSCKCPTSCSPCAGGILQYTLQYQGTSSANIVVKDASQIVYDNELHPGDLFVVKGVLADGRFSGVKIYLYIDGVENTAIDVLCTTNTVVNGVFGQFVIVEAKRLDGKEICCSNTNGTRRDAIDPVFKEAPSDIFVFAASDQCGAVVIWPEPLVEDCNLAEVISDFASGSVFPEGPTEVTYIATDLEGNSTPHKFNVTVTDNVPPEILNCPADQNITTKNPAGEVVTWIEPTAQDHCSESVELTSTRSPGTVFAAGTTTTVTYTATDARGNKQTCSFVVTVTLEEDTVVTPPPAEAEPLNVQVPAVITPDGDGRNDSWVLVNLEKADQNSVAVFDRWGSVVFEASMYDNDKIQWHGVASNGNKLLAGTYFYVITYTYAGAAHKKTGFIELIP